MQKKKKTISLATLRELRGISQRDLATSVGLSPGTVGHYESGNRKPSLENALKIANYFNMSVEQICFSSKEG